VVILKSIRTNLGLERIKNVIHERYRNVAKKLEVQRSHNVPCGRSIKVHSERPLSTLLERSMNVPMYVVAPEPQ